MFSATTPAKYCYRAVATFIKHVTNMPPTVTLQRHKGPPALSPSNIILEEEVVASPIASSPIDEDRPGFSLPAKGRSSSRPKGFSRITSSFRRGSSKSRRSRVEDENAFEDILAGDPIVYHGTWVSCQGPSSVGTKISQLQAKSPDHQAMIRERVSIHGVIRPLEAEQDLPALQVPPEALGTISELWVHRYIMGTASHEKRFAAHGKQISKRRERAIAKLRLRRSSHSRSTEDPGAEVSVSVSSTGWSLAWALEADECPPPSSLVARHDMVEVRAPGKRRRLRRADTTLSGKEEECRT